ncbi:hypothetical protein OKW30_001376 [Paraburkholderia sp. Clong3]|uniref:hypothetical protein n=1 Tax=Paraburkholderia sp. Clong3 TaxID=2991061 RepID=UPI003D227C49
MTTINQPAGDEMRANVRNALVSLECTAQWLENGCDPKAAAHELRLVMNMLHGIPTALATAGPLPRSAATVSDERAAEPHTPEWEAQVLASILRGMIEGCSEADPAVIYEDDYEAIDGDVYVRRAATLLDRFARAASTATALSDQLVTVAQMGHGSVAVGGCFSPEANAPGIIYMALDEPREINADTSDVYPVGARARNVLAFVTFANAAAVDQTIGILHELKAEYFDAEQSAAPQAETVPEGWKLKLVPVNPTKQQLADICESYWGDGWGDDDDMRDARIVDARNMYQAMLAAAPAAPLPRASEQADEAVTLPRVHGVSRIADNPCALMVLLMREPSDDDLRAIHDVLAARAKDRS